MIEERFMIINKERYTLTTKMVDDFIEQIADDELYCIFTKNSPRSLKEELYDTFDRLFNAKAWQKVWEYYDYHKNHLKRKRWVNKAISDYEKKSAKKPIELYAIYLRLKDVKDTLEKLNMDNGKVEIVKEMNGKILEIKEWAELRGKPLTDYPYFDDFTKNTKYRAATDDICLEFLLFIRDAWVKQKERDDIIVQKGYVPTNEVRDIPSGSQEIFIGKSSRKELEMDDEIEIDGISMKTKMVGNDSSPFHLFVEDTPKLQEMAENIAMDDKLLDFDPIDYSIFLSVLSKRSKAFIDQKTVHTTLGELVGDVYSSLNSQNYASVMNKIYKLARMKYVQLEYSKTPSDGGKKVLPKSAEIKGFFDYARFENQENGVVNVTIEINRSVHNQFINDQTYRIYKSQLDSLKPKYQMLLIYMQKVRLESHRNKTDVADINVSQFKSNLRFENRYQKHIIREIREGLDELVKMKTLIRKYTDAGALFTIFFYPLKSEEVEDIFGQDAEVNLKNFVPKEQRQSIIEHQSLRD